MAIDWTPGMKLEVGERQMVEDSYRAFNRVKTATANALGISVRTLEAYLARYEKADSELKDRVAKAKEDRDASLRRLRGIDPPQVSSLSPTVLKDDLEELLGGIEQSKPQTAVLGAPAPVRQALVSHGKRR